MGGLETAFPQRCRPPPPPPPGEDPLGTQPVVSSGMQTPSQPVYFRVFHLPGPWLCPEAPTGLYLGAPSRPCGARGLRSEKEACLSGRRAPLQMGLRGTPGPSHGGGGGSRPRQGCPLYVYLLSQPYEGSSCLPPPSLPSPTAIGKGSPHRPWVLQSHGQGCP